MKVLLADDRTEVRSALRLLLEQDSNIEVIGEATKLSDLMAKIEVACPDCILLDWELPDIDTEDSILKLHYCCPELIIIALSSWPEAREAALAAGANAFISKGDAPEKLLEIMEDCTHTDF